MAGQCQVLGCARVPVPVPAPGSRGGREEAGLGGQSGGPCHSCRLRQTWVGQSLLRLLRGRQTGNGRAFSLMANPHLLTVADCCLAPALPLNVAVRRVSEEGWGAGCGGHRAAERPLQGGSVSQCPPLCPGRGDGVTQLARVHGHFCELHSGHLSGCAHRPRSDTATRPHGHS